MLDSLHSPFVFHFIREGREDLLKSEVTSVNPAFRFSFSKPGFVAFKADRELSFRDLKSPLFARRTGLQFLKWMDGKETESRAKLAPVLSALKSSAHQGRLSVHAFDYLTSLGEDAPVSDHGIALAAANERSIWKSFVSELMKADFKSIEWNKKTDLGEAILTAVQVSEKEIWVGISLPGADDFLGVGGESGIVLPEAAPSRAYLKIEEAIALGGISLKPGDIAVEVGCSPGGACYSLLERGLNVIGVDRAIVAPNISKHPKFERIGTSVGEMLIANDFRAQWFLMDMNAEPAIALRECSALIERIKPGLLGAFLTLKFNREDSFDDLPKLTTRAARMLGLEKSWLRQLPSNNREVAFFGVTGNYLRSRS